MLSVTASDQLFLHFKFHLFWFSVLVCVSWQHQSSVPSLIWSEQFIFRLIIKQNQFQRLPIDSQLSFTVLWNLFTVSINLSCTHTSSSHKYTLTSLTNTQRYTKSNIQGKRASNPSLGATTSLFPNSLIPADAGSYSQEGNRVSSRPPLPAPDRCNQIKLKNNPFLKPQALDPKLMMNTVPTHSDTN